MSKKQIRVIVDEDTADEAVEIISVHLSDAGLLHEIEVYR